MSPEQLKFGKQDSVALVWSLGVLLYRVAFKDKHPFMLSEESIGNSIRHFQQSLDVKTVGLISQTRRNILLLRYNKADEKDIKGHKLQQLLD
jgi:serine/threonine protein kinase